MFEDLKEKELTEICVQDVLNKFQRSELVEIRILPMIFLNFFRPEKAFKAKVLETGKVGLFVEGKLLAGDSKAVLYFVYWHLFVPDFENVEAGIVLENLTDFFGKEYGGVRKLFVDFEDIRKRHVWLVELKFTKELFRKEFKQDVLDFFPGYQKRNENEQLELLFLKGKELSMPELQEQVDAMVKSVCCPRRELLSPREIFNKHRKNAPGFWARLKKFIKNY